jgi:S-adenosylmethionine:tRNA ribosyltransferase-isomerase
MTALAAPRFVRPPGSDATEPPERRGLPRDGVRLLVATPGRMLHRTFRDLPGLLSPGDLVVVNTSATLPAALLGRLPAPDADETVPIHVATALDDGTWVVEVRRRDNAGPRVDLWPGVVVRLPGDVTARLLTPFPFATAMGTRLWRAAVLGAGDLVAYLTRHGAPIAYGYLRDHVGLAERQTIFAAQPGSAEMPSAGRPFTDRLVVLLAVRGVPVAPVVLHAGLSSPEAPEPPAPERFEVPAATARLVEATRAGGGRIVAVGTTVARALETCADADGRVAAGSGWTDLVLGPDRPARVVTGLVTGLHEPEASHLLLLEAVAGAHLVDRAYAAVTATGAPRYLWHEFGDAMLFLP